MKRFLSAVLLVASSLGGGCCSYCTLVGPTTTISGKAVDQNGQPVPYCPLVGRWEHFYPFPYMDPGHSSVFMTDLDGEWAFSRRGVTRIFVGVGKDSNQSYFPGYRPMAGHPGSVGGEPREIKNPYTVWVQVDTNAAAKPFVPRPSDPRGEQYRRLRQQHPPPYPEQRAVQER